MVILSYLLITHLPLQQIRLNRHQYEILSRLAHNEKFSALPKRWLEKHPFHSWSHLTNGTGKTFHWGLCWEWAGPLKFGLIAEGYDQVDELYSTIFKVVEQLGSMWHFSKNKPKLLSESTDEHPPYTFLTFTHMGDELFQVTHCPLLQKQCDSRKGYMQVAKSVNQTNLLTILQTHSSSGQ